MSHSCSERASYLGLSARNLNAYWQAYFSYTTTAIAITLMWLLDDLLVNWLGLDSKKPAGMAVEKVTDAVILISTVILLSKLFRVSLGSIYLQRGKLKLGLIFGILGFAVMATFGVLQARSLGISFERSGGGRRGCLTSVWRMGLWKSLSPEDFSRRRSNQFPVPLSSTWLPPLSSFSPTV